jgi:TolB protein
MFHALSLGRRLLPGALAAVALVTLIACQPLVPPVLPGDGTTTVAPLPRSAAPLPTGTLVMDSDRSGHFEIYTTTSSGVTTAITNGTTYDSWWARLSPDRRTIVFQRTPKGVHDRDYDLVELWAVAADGGDAVRLRTVGQDGWVHQGHVEWSPDGKKLVAFGGTRYDTQIFLLELDGSHPTAVTNRPGVNLDPSFLPDGRSLAFVGCPNATCYPENYEIYVIPTSGGVASRLTYDALVDHDPYAAPDGAHLAWITQTAPGWPGEWDVTLANVDGSGARRLFNDHGNAGAPVWAGSSTLLVHRFPPGQTAFQIYRVATATGTAANLTGDPAYSNEYPSP